MRRLILVLALLAPLAIPLPGASATHDPTERSYDERGRLVAESGIVPGERNLAFVRHYYLESSGIAANDCASNAYKLTRWSWSGPYDVWTTAYAPEVTAALDAWDSQTSRTLAGSVTLGSAGTAGVRDYTNQIDWVDLGATSTIAVTTTWYYRLTGQAVESDGQYNTRFAWDTTGSATAMDVQNIATHEVGHTLGLDHPKGKTVSCLTMHAYAGLGETQKRTLGAGDILGIQARYGA